MKWQKLRNPIIPQGKKNPFSLVYLGTRRKLVEQHNLVA